MRRMCACFLLIASQLIPVFARQAGPVEPAGGSYELWMARSKTITEDLLKDAEGLTPFERALIWAKLSRRWWRDDPERAHSWMLKPVEMVEAVPNRESPADRSQRLAKARQLLNIVAPLDQKLSQRLVAVLTEGAERSAQDERSANADGLVEVALTVAESDPQRAAELGALALSIGRPDQVAPLLIGLRYKDTKLADALLSQTLEAARRAPERTSLNALTQVAFLEVMQPGATSPAPPDKLRTELLKLDVAYLQANPISAANREAVCTGVVAFIAPVLPQFERLLPQQADIARQSVSQCRPSEPIARQRLDDALRYQPLNTVDDLLKAADAATDTKVRAVYSYRAAALAKEKNDLDRALKILDGMSSGEREFMGGSWEAYRWEWAALSALKYFKSGDVSMMHLVINAVPADLQPFAKIAFVGRLPSPRSRESDPTLTFLDEAREGLRRSTVSEAEKCSWYLGLLRLTVKYQPAQAAAVLKETVAALNRVGDRKGKGDGTADDRAHLVGSISKSLPSSLLEMDEYAVREAVASINAADIRAEVRLELLGVCLARLRNSKPATPGQKPQPPASKGN
jgi:hypothetical protein